MQTECAASDMHMFNLQGGARIGKVLGLGPFSCMQFGAPRFRRAHGGCAVSECSCVKCHDYVNFAMSQHARHRMDAAYATKYPQEILLLPTLDPKHCDVRPGPVLHGHRSRLSVPFIPIPKP